MLGCAFVVAGSPHALAHEFWIDPIARDICPGTPLAATLHVGEGFDGAEAGTLSAALGTVWRQDDRGTVQIRRVANRAALGEAQGGLTTLAYRSPPRRHHYGDWRKFLAFAVADGHPWAIEEHVRAGLPRTGFAETYRRFAKTLVGVGPAALLDTAPALGLDFEIVVRASPLFPNQEAVPVTLLRRGEPAADLQLTVFTRHRASGQTHKRSHRTDANGEVPIALRPDTEYLLSSVDLRRSEENGVAWHSDWTSLTFATPPEHAQDRGSIFQPCSKP